MESSVPFESGDVMGGLGECTGLLRATHDARAIEVQWQTKDSFFGVLKSGIQDRTIPLADVEGVTFKKGWIGGKLSIESRDLGAVDGIPGGTGTSLTVSIKRKNYRAAAAFASDIDLMISQRKLESAAASAGLDAPCDPLR